MISASFLSAFAAVAMLSVATASEGSTAATLIPTPSVTLPANAMTSVGCFETGTPLVNYGPYEFQSPGNCQFICIMLKKPYMGLTDGTDCWCGDTAPPKQAQVANGTCDTTCGGTDKELCGGPSAWWVVGTGTTRNKIEYAEPESSSSSSAKPSSTAQSTVAAPTKSAAVVSETSEPKEDKGPNKAGIAAGVVVGVVALAAIIGGMIFFLRQRKRREIEEEHRRRDAVNSFMAGGKPHTSNSSMTDSRLDPEFMSRRQSNGSIADNEDYSRRILKVTNV